MLEEERLTRAIEQGMKLSKRIYYGKGENNPSQNYSVVSPPQQQPIMDKKLSAPSSSSFSNSYSSYLLPTSPMVYAVISDPSIVDNPDIPSFQPHIHGKCVPTALIPLHMKQISMEIECFLDTAFVTVIGVWRVHCVKRNRSCFCRLIVPMAEQVDVNGREYTTQLIPVDENMDTGKLVKSHRGGFLTPEMFAITIPQVEGGSNISVKINWSQKLSFTSGQFSLTIPFKFPEFVTPPVKGNSKIEKITLNVESGAEAEVLGLKVSHPLKIVRKQVGRLECSYEADVSTWSQNKFRFSYAISCTAVSTSDILGGLLLYSPSKQDLDKREMFCFYLYPGHNQSKKVFRKEVVFLIDISGSMQGRPLESVKDALFAALRNLNQEDSFSLIALSGETFLFSSTLQLATTETVEKATLWIQTNFVAAGGTNILLPLSQAMEMLSNIFDSDSISHIFLITDGSVENEKHICELIRNQVAAKGSRFPRISTFGIGIHCNHYFLQMLALISKGHYGAALHPDHIEIQFQRLFTTASSTVLANIVVDELNHLDAIEVYPRYIPDLSSGNPLIVSGRYKGEFPDSLKISGFLSDVSNFTINLKPQRAKGIIALERVVAKKQIDLLTAQAWLSQSKELEEKVAQISIQSSVPSEYTRMILCQTEREIQAFESVGLQEVHRVNLEKLVDSKGRKIILLRSLGYGFGSIKATAENVFPRFGDPLFPDSASDPITKAASTFCAQYCHCCCCMCLIRTCSHVNNQCAVVLSQFITALTCFGCLECCVDLCCDF
ncbi:von Willebrand factor A domain-containing protein 5A-like isoform X2 [Papaver somniferum]|uniref:von Willebrand factor A domain-containing protein 5A-like isoform X2 n=1 Tax=Papaver somniferum TaxID=3469 RepID=UPI000E704E3C|nr:von Willebrand factor A domain-containing protein 5A-like isoform X2 [Papaver somniferum]